MQLIYLFVLATINRYKSHPKSMLCLYNICVCAVYIYDMCIYIYIYVYIYKRHTHSIYFETILHVYIYNHYLIYLL